MIAWCLCELHSLETFCFTICSVFAWQFNNLTIICLSTLYNSFVRVLLQLFTGPTLYCLSKLQQKLWANHSWKLFWRVCISWADIIFSVYIWYLLYVARNFLTLFLLWQMAFRKYVYFSTLWTKSFFPVKSNEKEYWLFVSWLSVCSVILYNKYAKCNHFSCL